MRMEMGRTLRVARRDPVADLLVVTLGDGREVSLGSQAARHLLVEQDSGASLGKKRRE